MGLRLMTNRELSNFPFSFLNLAFSIYKTKRMKKLFEEFPQQSKADWLRQVAKDLKGKALDSLNWDLGNGLVFSPFAHGYDFPESPPPIFNNKTTNHWEAGVILMVSDYKVANKQSLELLNGGANALCFKLSHSPDKDELSQLLADIQLEWISTHFMVQQEYWIQLTEHFLEVILEKKLDPSSVVCSFDIVGSPVSEEKEWQHLQYLTRLLPKGHFLTVNSISLFDKKENTANALANTIQQANSWLSTLNEKGLPVKDYLHSFQFNISLTDSYFLNIATIRALRILWQQVLQAWDADWIGQAPIIVHLDEHTQVEDEHYNKIKSGTQAMAAVIGGADRLYIYPSDEFKNSGGTAFSRRIALNVHHLLQMESYLDRVVDPAAGSYYLENMTNKLGEAAWDIFRNR
jgi:methylmalonyl-CoA mutase